MKYSAPDFINLLYFVENLCRVFSIMSAIAKK